MRMNEKCVVGRQGVTAAERRRFTNCQRRKKNFGDAISPLEHVGQIPKRWEKVVGDIKCTDSYV